MKNLTAAITEFDVIQMKSSKNHWSPVTITQIWIVYVSILVFHLMLIMCAHKMKKNWSVEAVETAAQLFW